MDFKEHAVSYMDILGFKHFVEQAENSSEKRRVLDKLFHEVIPREISIDGRNSQFPTKLGMHCLSFSDSIIVSAPVLAQAQYPALAAISIKAIQIAHALLDVGLLVRGAIAVGNVYRTDFNILGTGYQEAVKKEESDGLINPQIVLTDSAKQKLDELIEKGYPRYSIFAKNEVGEVILDSIFPERTYLPDETGEVVKYFGDYRGIIINNIECLTDIKAKNKWIWFARLFNENLKTFSSLIGDIDEIKIDETLLSPTLNYLNPPDPGWMENFVSHGRTIVFSREKSED